MKKSLILVVCLFAVVNVMGCKRTASVSVIGGADGPTSIYLAPGSNKQEKASETDSNGEETVVNDKSTEEVSEEDTSQTESVSSDQNLKVTERDEPWRSAYLEYLSKDDYIAEYGTGDYGFTFTLIYLDNDDIPELFVDTGIEAGGQIIATYYDGKVIEQHFPRLGSQYIEKSGLIYTNTGHMDYYPLTITKLENGTFTEIGSGLSYVTEEDRDKMINDENHPYILTYEWEGEKVSEDQFNAYVAELYDLEQSKYPVDMHDYDEIVGILKE